MDGPTDRSTGRIGAALLATAEAFRHAGLRLLDVALPPRCVGCGTRDSWICPDCCGTLPVLPSQRCRVCAVPQPGPQVCADCYRNPPRFDALHSAFLHQGLARELVHGLKYRGHRHLAEPLAAAAAAAIPSHIGFDAVIPVPLHQARQRERGFNQSQLLAEQLKLPLRGGLERIRPTDSQAGLTQHERVANVRGAFKATDRFDGQTVLLVDDVCTTGATLDACAGALKRAGAARVAALTVSRAVNTQ